MSFASAGIDPRVAYIVMLNATENESLDQIIIDLRPRGFVPVEQTVDAARRALLHLLDSGWVSLRYETALGGGIAIAENEVSAVLAGPQSWQPNSDGRPSPIAVNATDAGLHEWLKGFPAVELSEQARAALMFPQHEPHSSSQQTEASVWRVPLK